MSTSSHVSCTYSIPHNGPRKLSTLKIFFLKKKFLNLGLIVCSGDQISNTKNKLEKKKWKQIFRGVEWLQVLPTSGHDLFAGLYSITLTTQIFSSARVVYSYTTPRNIRHGSHSTYLMLKLIIYPFYFNYFLGTALMFIRAH